MILLFFNKGADAEDFNPGLASPIPSGRTERICAANDQFSGVVESYAILQLVVSGEESGDIIHIAEGWEAVSVHGYTHVCRS